MFDKSRFRFYAVGLLLCLVQQWARADLWAYVDDQGVTHFAPERVDGRYQLFFHISEAQAYSDGAAETQTGPSSRSGSGVVSASGARLLAFFDTAVNFRDVRLHLRAAATTHGVDYELLKALIVTESGFDAQALSPKGAVGLMQLMPATAHRFGVSADARRTVSQKLVDPAVNVSTGTRYLRYLLDLFPDRMDLALAAYNAGEGAVQRAGNRIPAFKETQNYVRTVMELYAQLKPLPAASAYPATSSLVRVQMQGGALNRGNLPQTSAESVLTKPSPAPWTSPHRSGTEEAVPNE